MIFTAFESFLIMWKVVSLSAGLLMALPSHSKMAGGMVHWTNEGIDISPGGIMRYISGNDEADTASILEKEKAYYAASVDKTLSRLALARSHIDAADLTEKERSMLHGRLDSGISWLKMNKKAFISARDRASFEKEVDLKMWHAVKMLPTASEGYSIACAIEKCLDKAPDSRGKAEAIRLDSWAKSTFLRLLNLDGRTDFAAAEKDRIEAFSMLSRADNWLKKVAA